MRSLFVALRKESVDRNVGNIICQRMGHVSLSARRAWIEILAVVPVMPIAFVALRKESVDRNCYCAAGTVTQCAVALRKESVDRNVIGQVKTEVIIGRSPQGERG